MDKLNAYSVAAFTFLSAAQAATAQVVYFDVDPDLMTDDERIFLDVNSDGEMDIWFDLFNSGFFGAQYSSAYAGNQNAYVQLATNGLLPGAQGLKAFSAGELIDSGDNWVTPAPYFGDLLGRFVFFDYSSCEDPLVYFPYGDFFNITDGYLAFRIEDGGNYNYGWVRLSIPQAPPCPLPLGDALTIIVSDYAIQNTPNTTIAAGMTGCAAPENLNAEAAATALKITWDAAFGAELYKIQYRIAGTLTWSTKTVPAPKTAQIIKGLTCNTMYEYQIAAICGGEVSAFTDMQNISTLECKIGAIATPDDMHIFPNPANATITIQVDDLPNIKYVNITDLHGNSVFSGTENANTIQVDVSGLPAGPYFISLQADDVLRHAYFVKQ